MIVAIINSSFIISRIYYINKSGLYNNENYNGKDSLIDKFFIKIEKMYPGIKPVQFTDEHIFNNEY